MVTPEELLAKAESLLKTAKSELDYRGAVESAYYAAYHAALAFEEALPHRSSATPARGGAHEVLIYRLERPSHQLEYGLRIISLELGAQLRILKPLREHATYILDESVRVDHAEAAIRGAKDLLPEATKGMKKIKP